MESRTNKYDNSETSMSRTKKNQRLYNEINDLKIDSFDYTNSEILGNNGKTIDVERLRDMLDKKYREEPKNKSLVDIDENEKTQDIKLNETREYDINQILSKAKEEKQAEDYEVERLKKLKNTQVNILSDLNIDNLKKEDIQIKAVSDEEGKELRTLIDTINLTEETNAIKNLDPLDLFSDLKGEDDATKVKGVNELTNEILKEAEKESLKEENKKDKKKDKEVLENSFYTTSSILKNEDFDDFADLKDDLNGTKIIVRILIVVVILAFICGVVFLLNRILEWGLF